MRQLGLQLHLPRKPCPGNCCSGRNAAAAMQQKKELLLLRQECSGCRAAAWPAAAGAQWLQGRGAASSGCGSSNCTVCIAERFFVQRHFRVMPLQWMKQLKLEPVLLCHLDSTTQADTESAIATTAREPTMHADHAIVQLVRPQLGIPHDQIVWHRFASRPAYDWSAPVLRMQGAGWVCRGL